MRIASCFLMLVILAACSDNSDSIRKGAAIEGVCISIEIRYDLDDSACDEDMITSDYADAVNTCYETFGLDTPDNRDDWITCLDNQGVPLGIPE